LLYYSKAKDIYPYDKHLQLFIAELYLVKGDISQAEIAFGECKKKYGLNQYLIDDLIRLSARGELQDEVEHILRDIFKLKEITKSDKTYGKGPIERDYYTDSYYKRGLERKATGDHQGAKQDFNMAQLIYLNTLKTYNVEMDGEDLIKAHKFIYHSKVEGIKDEDLIKKLERLVKNESSPIYCDALAKLYSNLQNYQKAVKYSNLCLQMIRKAPYKIRDKKHLSEYYYYCACHYSHLGAMESAIQMLKETFAVSRDLYELSLEDPKLEKLRNYLGEVRFKSMF